MMGTPFSASVKLGQFVTDPDNDRFTRGSYNGETFVTREWLVGKMNPLLTFLGNQMQTMESDVAYNHRAAAGTIAGLVGVLFVFAYYLTQYLRTKWSKRGKREINIPVEIHHEVPHNAGGPIVVRRGHEMV